MSKKKKESHLINDTLKSETGNCAVVMSKETEQKEPINSQSENNIDLDIIQRSQENLSQSLYDILIRAFSYEKGAWKSTTLIKKQVDILNKREDFDTLDTNQDSKTSASFTDIKEVETNSDEILELIRCVSKIRILRDLCTLFEVPEYAPFLIKSTLLLDNSMPPNKEDVKKLLMEFLSEKERENK